MADNETPQAATAEAPQASTQTAPAEPPSTPAPLTIDSIRDALIPEVRKELKAAYDAARRAEAKAERAPLQVMERFAPLEAAIETVLTRDMDDNQREAFKAKRELERERQTRQPEPSFDDEVRSFQAEATSILEEEGIDPKDPILNESFQRFGQGARTAPRLVAALNRAVAEVHKTGAKKVREEAAERERKAREDERAKILNETRAIEGAVDRSRPASSGKTKTNYLALSQEEWLRVEAEKDAERARRRAQVARLG